MTSDYKTLLPQTGGFIFKGGMVASVYLRAIQPRFQLKVGHCEDGVSGPQLRLSSGPFISLRSGNAR